MTASPGDRPGLVLATNNAAKLAEFRRLLPRDAPPLLSLADMGFTAPLLEPGDTYEGNALAKAAVVADALRRPALADDSGIEVEALGGWPGPASARWLGPDADDHARLRALLEEVDRRCPGARRVRYVCVLALCRPLADPLLVWGACAGTIVPPRGHAGFGYDPAFLSRDLGITFGEATAAAKDGVSHRGRAVRQLDAAGLLAAAAAAC